MHKKRRPPLLRFCERRGGDCRKKLYTIRAKKCMFFYIRKKCVACSFGLEINGGGGESGECGGECAVFGGVSDYGTGGILQYK